MVGGTDSESAVSPLWCTEYALALMANEHTTAWDQWTEANRGHSQEEWIRDGFLRYGIKVHLPPERDDTVPLLRLLGRKSWTSSLAGRKVQRHRTPSQAMSITMPTDGFGILGLSHWSSHPRTPAWLQTQRFLKGF